MLLIISVLSFERIAFLVAGTASPLAGAVLLPLFELPSVNTSVGPFVLAEPGRLT
jgi:hypothetical protein